jgi:hypothetical protein
MSLRNLRATTSKNSLKKEETKEIIKEDKKEEKKELNKEEKNDSMKNLKEKKFIIRLMGKDGQFNYEGEGGEEDKFIKVLEFISDALKIDKNNIKLSKEPEKNYFDNCFDKKLKDLNIK